MMYHLGQRDTVARPATHRVALLLCVAAAAAAAQAQPRPTVDVSVQGARVSVTANNVERADMLRALAERAGISVRSEVDPVGRTSVQLRDVSPDSAVRAILGPSARYVLRLGELEVTDTTPTPDRRKVGRSEQRATVLGVKDRTRPFRPTLADRVRLKPVADSTERRSTPVRGLPLKPNTAEQPVPEGRGPKEPIRTTQPTDSSIRVSFIMRRPADVQVVRVQRVPGIAPRVTQTRGPILYTVRDATGRVVYVGSILDPLEQHDPSPSDSLHGSRLMAEGPFAITLPHAVVTEQTLATLRLDFYDARMQYVPPTLDERTFAGIARGLERTATFRGADLARALRSATGRPR